LNKVVCAYCQEEVLPGAFCRSCGAPLEVVRGDLVGTDIHAYHIEHLLAEGGSGRVYQARHRGTGAAVALKVLLPELAGSPKAIRRFRREAEVGIRLQHPHAVKLFEFGIDREIGLFLVMELINGPNLSDELEKTGPFHPSRAIPLVLQLCSVLEKAHDLNILHRDLKPANVMLQTHSSGKEWVKICDFGTAKLEIETGAYDTVLTLPGTLCGTPGYMSPEQCRGDTPDARSDLYSVGVLLFEMLAGEQPFEGGDTLVEMLMRTIENRPRTLLEVHPALKTYPYLKRLQHVIDTCMQPHPDDRYQNATALMAELYDTLPTATLDQPSFSVSATEERELLLPVPPASYPWTPVRLDGIELQEIRNLAQQLQPREFVPGQALYQPGQHTEDFHLILEGEIRVLVQSEHQIVEVDRLGPDDFVGVSAFFARAPYPFVAEAARMSKLYSIARTTFARWVSQSRHHQDLFREFYYEFLLQEVMRYSAFFDSIPSQQRVELMREFEIMPVGRGQQILREGQRGEELYLIASGQVEIYWQGEGEEKRRRSRYLSPGHFFGEIALLTEQPVSASVRAHTNTVLLKLPKEALLELLKPYPKVLHLMNRIARTRMEENDFANTNDRLLHL
tara:strand:+ start:3073 stop:4932 length:1860 start_codon:yes stop_codon:yes gene_type:complete